MGKKRTKKNVRRITKQPAAYHVVSEQERAIRQTRVRDSSVKPRLLSQSTNQVKILVTRKIIKQSEAHGSNGEARESEGARCTAVEPQIYTKSDRKTNKEARLFQNVEPISQEQRRITQQARASKITKPPLPQKQNAEDRGSDGGETLIRRQLCRRPRVGQRITAVRVTRDGHVDMSSRGDGVTSAPFLNFARTDFALTFCARIFCSYLSLYFETIYFSN